VHFTRSRASFSRANASKSPVNRIRLRLLNKTLYAKTSLRMSESLTRCNFADAISRDAPFYSRPRDDSIRFARRVVIRLGIRFLHAGRRNFAFRFVAGVRPSAARRRANATKKRDRHPGGKKREGEADPWPFLKGLAESCGSSRATTKSLFFRGLNARERRTKRRKNKESSRD